MTSTAALACELPAALLATQEYTPWSLSDTLYTEISLVWTSSLPGIDAVNSTPSLYHASCGNGSPVALQVKLKLLPVERRMS